MYSLVSQLCLMGLMAGASGPGAVDSDARVWLQRMGNAVENINYEGTFVHVINGDTAETLHIVHKVENGHVFERLISLDGGGREIIRKDDEVRCVLKDQKSVVVEKREFSPLLSSLPNYQATLDDFYHFKIVGRDRVANRDTRVIEVRPRDEYRYGHRLWLDEETAMPLRSALISNSGAVVEQVLFTSVRLGEAISDEALQPKLSAEGFKWIVEEQSDDAENGESAWQAESLPRGFKLTVARTHGAKEQKPDQYIYTDGLASVSVFVEPAPEGAKPINGLSTIGSANAYATMISGYQVTAVGEVPPSTVEMIGASLKRKK